MSLPAKDFVPIEGLPSNLWEQVSFDAGVRIFSEGDPADALYAVRDGRVRIELERAELDSESVLNEVREGVIFGEQGLLDGGTRSASAFAETAVDAWRLSMHELHLLEETQPAVAAAAYRALGRAVSLKLRAANERYARVAFDPRDLDVDGVVAAARESLPILETLSDAVLDSVIERVADAIAQRAEVLATATVEATGMGCVADKTRKNLFASAGTRATLLGKTGTGVLGGDAVVELGAPAGVVFGLIPVTNPVATAVFKVLSCLKCRNAVILNFPRRAAVLGSTFSDLMDEILQENGLPPGAVQCVTHRSSRRMTDAFFRHDGVDLILATGGRSMVEAAYRSGKPAIGVGPGNAPTLVCSDADLAATAAKVVESKSFDCGLICGSEHNLVVVRQVEQEFIAALEACGAAVLEADEVQRFEAKIITPDRTSIRYRYSGKAATVMAEASGISRTGEIKLIVVRVPLDESANTSYLGGEKMAPVLSLFTVADEDEGFRLCRRLLDREGRGHTAVIHTEDRDRALAYADSMPASRVLVNSPATHGVIGQTTRLAPSLVLGCGLYGGNSTGDNVNFTHLRNVKRLAFFTPPESS